MPLSVTEWTRAALRTIHTLVQLLIKKPVLASVYPSLSAFQLRGHQDVVDKAFFSSDVSVGVVFDPSPLLNKLFSVSSFKPLLSDPNIYC